MGGGKEEECIPNWVGLLLVTDEMCAWGTLSLIIHKDPKRTVMCQVKIPLLP